MTRVYDKRLSEDKEEGSDDNEENKLEELQTERLVKKNTSLLCLELLQFVLLILITPFPFIFTQPLVIYSCHYTYMCDITLKPWSYLTLEPCPVLFPDF